MSELYAPYIVFVNGGNGRDTEVKAGMQLTDRWQIYATIIDTSSRYLMNVLMPPDAWPQSKYSLGPW